jgi:hypothetical protein
LCHFWMKDKCKNPDTCHRWHPQTCRMWLSKSGCALGAKCNFRHFKPEKSSKAPGE